MDSLSVYDSQTIYPSGAFVKRALFGNVTRQSEHDRREAGTCIAFDHSTFLRDAYLYGSLNLAGRQTRRRSATRRDA